MRFLHLHSGFDAGGKEVRAVRLMKAFGPAIRHRIVSALPGAYGAAELIDPALEVELGGDFPPLQGRPTPARLHRLAEAMCGYDLVLTYNWGAMDTVLAHRLHARRLGLPPLVHHEDGFNEDEAQGLKWQRNLFRRFALGGAFALVVPSLRLEGIALGAWKQPRARVRLISNGIATAAYAKAPPVDAIAGLVKAPGARWLGTLAGLRAVKDLPQLVRAFARMPGEWELVILGEGPERGAIEAQARACGVAERVHLPGFVADPSRAVGLFDLFALSSRSEQFPISVVESMAAGLAVAAPAVGDVAAMVAPENHPYVTAPGDEAALAAALCALAGDGDLRARVGQANRVYAARHYDENVMISAYRRTYAGAMGLADLP
ncbi:glycosyltransferase [Novosphingobium profundi]|uniref:glycosyltransferase n=1 Tax=Novosphingobium profundi TaxID=1774954 RepID=UPI001BDA5EE9|nr:glycosyltransferase [Novosphingobium profundi]MBT0669919.1 glycosyltransferase [Novosphingobium profundi]